MAFAFKGDTVQCSKIIQHFGALFQRKLSCLDFHLFFQAFTAAATQHASGRKHKNRLFHQIFCLNLLVQFCGFNQALNVKNLKF